MTDAPDFAALARQYLDLWEDQLAAIAGDPTLAEQTARFFQSLNQPAAAGAPLATAQMATLAQQFMTLAGLAGASAGAGGNTDHGDTSRSAPTDGPAGAAAATAAPGDGLPVLDELASRLAAIEERLDRLDAGGRGTRRRAEPSAGSRRKSAPKSGSRRKKPTKS